MRDAELAARFHKILEVISKMSKAEKLRILKDALEHVERYAEEDKFKPKIIQ